MIPQTALDHFSRIALDNGLRLLQGFRLHPTDSGHVERLLSLMKIEGGDWLDVGSGFGEFARLAARLRPDLRFTLLNYNAFQLSHSPKDVDCVRGDMHSLPFADGSFDGVLFLYSLCHADRPVTVLNEARRVVRRGASLVVYDYTGVDSDVHRTWDELRSRFYEPQMLEGLGAICGWQTEKWIEPDGQEIAFINHPSFVDLRATLWKAVAV